MYVNVAFVVIYDILNTIFNITESPSRTNVMLADRQLYSTTSQLSTETSL